MLVSRFSPFETGDHRSEDPTYLPLPWLLVLSKINMTNTLRMCVPNVHIIDRQQENDRCCQEGDRFIGH